MFEISDFQEFLKKMHYHHRGSFVYWKETGQKKDSVE